MNLVYGHKKPACFKRLAFIIPERWELKMGHVKRDHHNEIVEMHMKPIDVINGFSIRPGLYDENGTVVIPGGVSFTIHSQDATSIKLILFKREAKEPYAILPFPETYRVGNVYSMIVFGLDIEEFEYAYSVDGPWHPEKGLIFDESKYLLDPYARAVTGQSDWGKKPDYGQQYRARVVTSDFDWGDSKQPYIPMQDLIIYELHVRGYTKDASSGVKHKGTFAGLMEKIPYLIDLGVNAVELMPIFEFDEMMDQRTVDGEVLYDYWGYNPVSFFAPNTAYTANIEYNREGKELKTLIKKLNENGIEVFLDVVFNHTAEGNEEGPYISFKGLDNHVYYMLTPNGKYYNFSGCGNTLNCNHPIVQRMILDCLRYWVIEYRVDGFRFDLAAILGRNEDGSPMSNPPLLQNLAFDPILAKVKLIAEAWDAAGLYQVGSFPSWNRWSEWNGKYRDEMRQFLKGDSGFAQIAADRMSGSQDLYGSENCSSKASVNFITCHDGFTLYDLYAYNKKHNKANGWDNTDGEEHNHSWNCGVEGDTEDESIQKLRKRMMKNAMTALLTSHGTPMLRAGDEFANSQHGNNNAYCQDNEISWLNWEQVNKNEDLLKYVKGLIRFRKNHPVVRGCAKEAFCGLPSVSKHGSEPWYLEPSGDVHVLGMMYAGRDDKNEEDEIVYIGLNMHWEPQKICLPDLPESFVWKCVADTAERLVEEIHETTDKMPAMENDVMMEPRSAMVLIAAQP